MKQVTLKLKVETLRRLKAEVKRRNPESTRLPIGPLIDELATTLPPADARKSRS